MELGQERPPHAALFSDGADNLLVIPAQLSFWLPQGQGLAVPWGTAKLKY